MSRAVLMSINPKWCELIAHGQKTIEVRKTRPKLETPFKVYIYCTKDFKFNTGYSYKTWASYCKVMGEFVCDAIYGIDKDSVDFMFRTEADSIYFEEAEEFNLRTCIDENDLMSYLNHRQSYGWRISDLVIYDKPKELNEFRKPEMPTGLRYENDTITRPPQSWCYVEEVPK